MTPHIRAKNGDFAKLVLMPGDPLRAKYIAEKFLENPKLVNDVRNMFMYTGTYKGQPISVCGSGMGQPSIGIYAHELYAQFGVETIIRIGSAGAYTEQLDVYDVVLATEAYSDSTVFSEAMTGESTHITKPSSDLNSQIKEKANKLGINISEGRVHSSDVFYNSAPLDKTIQRTGNAVCVEMESGALFAVAKKLGKKAACLLTISDHLITKKETTAEERQNSFEEMMKIALEMAL